MRDVQWVVRVGPETDEFGAEPREIFVGSQAEAELTIYDLDDADEWGTAPKAIYGVIVFKTGEFIETDPDEESRLAEMDNLDEQAEFFEDADEALAFYVGV